MEKAAAEKVIYLVFMHMGAHIPVISVTQDWEIVKEYIRALQAQLIEPTIFCNNEFQIVLGKVIVSLHVDFEGGSSSQYDYASLAKLSALTASQSLDILIGDQSAIFQYAAASAYEPLTQLLTNDMYERLKDYILMAPDETGTPQPVALSLKSTEFTAKTGIDMDPPYLAVMASSPRKEAALQMISYLFPETP